MKLKSIVTLLIAGGLVSPLAYATNGMNMEGYGPVAASMGGASMAYDNGTAGVINNPATLGLMASGTSRFDLAVGDLMPSATSQGQDSQAKDFYMPAMGYIKKSDKLAFGVGMMAQGGMGTEYSDSKAFGTLNNFDVTAPSVSVVDPKLMNRSTVGVGRLIFPLAYNATQDLTIGGSVDYVWSGMSLKWLIDGSHFGSLMSAGSFGSASNSLVGTFVTALPTTPGMTGSGTSGCGPTGCFSAMNWGYFNFDNGNSFSPEAKGSGYAGNIGFTYKVAPKLTVGGVYHAKTNLSDMKTGSDEAHVTFNVTLTAAGSGAMTGGLAPAGSAVPIELSGQVIVKDFQWPETYGFGLSYQATDEWQLVGDYKRINWADVMKNFQMSFIASATQSSPTLTGFFGGKVLDVTFSQNWKNQNVLQLGAAYKYSNELTLRFGGNFANNPVPDSTVTPLFPAIMKTHYTGGLGYVFSKANSMDVSFVYAPKVTAINNWSAAGGSNQTISLGGTSWQAMYSHNF
jgi:long-chain fatty acid transport protein